MTTRRPNIPTVMAQAAVGYVAANFLLILARILLVSHPYNLDYVFVLPAVLMLAPLVGSITGMFIWAGFELAGNSLNTVYRSIIGVTLMALGWIALIAFCGAPFPPPHLQFWVLGMMIAPGIGMGLVTGSRLRLWREFVRGGDRVGVVLGVFAGLTGVLLRFVVVVLFMASAIALICILQAPDPQQIHWLWWTLMFTHFTAADVMLFARLKSEVLLPLAVVVNSPLVAVSLTFPWLRYLVIGYLALWAVFAGARR